MKSKKTPFFPVLSTFTWSIWIQSKLSNLNRQFLFRRRILDSPKLKWPDGAALKMNPSVSITAHFANITDTTKFPIAFFKQFDLVMNALDNLAARRYVNLMCLMVLRVPLIESGTAGYLGQTSIIILGVSSK